MGLFGTRQMAAPPGSTAPPIATPPLFIAKHRILTGEFVVFRFRCQPPTSTGTFRCSARILYDDGATEDWSSTYINNSTNSVNTWSSRDVFLGEDRTGTTINKPGATRARRNGYVIALSCTQIAGTTFKYGEAYVEAFIPLGNDDTQYRDRLARGYVYGLWNSRKQGTLTLDQDEPLDYGPLYIVQGAIAEDATAGSHICTLTLTTVTGSGIQVEYGTGTVGNTATAQALVVYVDDGTNLIARVVQNTSFTAANSNVSFPANAVPSTAANSGIQGATTQGIRVSSGMRFIMQVTTIAVSVTQTFAVAFRVKGQIPARTLNDTIGASVNTTNTDAFFE